MVQENTGTRDGKGYLRSGKSVSLRIRTVGKHEMISFCLLVSSCLKSQKKLFSQSTLLSVDLLSSIKQYMYEKKIAGQIYISFTSYKMRDRIG